MKHIFQDIIPNDKRSIRNIPLTKRDDTIDKKEIEDSMVDPVDAKYTTKNFEQGIDGIHHTKIQKKKNVTHSEKVESIVATHELENKDESFEEWQSHRKGGQWKTLALLGGLIVLAIIFVPLYFSSATIRISPIRHDISIKSIDIALKDVVHDVIQTEVSDSIDIKANGTIKVERKATGSIVLYNAFNSSSQKLVAGTRLQTPNGLIYRLKNPVTIPAQKTTGNKSVPGSAEASVEADQAGDTYNQGFRDFNVVAYKGSDRYEKIYGRSKTALTNGYLGTVPNISQKDIASSTSTLKLTLGQEIDQDFVKKAKSKGSEYTYISDAKKIVYNDVVQKVNKDGTKATLTLSAKASALLFNTSAISELIVKSQQGEQIASTTPTNEEESSGDTIVYEGDLTKLKVAFNPTNANSTTIDETTTILTLSGSTSITSSLDKTKVARAVSNLTKEQAVAALKKIVELESVDIEVSPWWKSKLPSAGRIDIQVEN